MLTPSVEETAVQVVKAEPEESVAVAVPVVSAEPAARVVSADTEAQAEAAAKLLPVLTQDETSVFKRGRNAKVNSVPHNADIGQYHAATGLEALFGWLYLRDDHARINELFNRMMEDDNAT